MGTVVGSKPDPWLPMSRGHRPWGFRIDRVPRTRTGLSKEWNDSTETNSGRTSGDHFILHPLGLIFTLSPGGGEGGDEASGFGDPPPL